VLIDKNIVLLFFLAIFSNLAYPPINLIFIFFITYGYLYYNLSKIILLKQYLLYVSIFAFALYSVGTFWLFSIMSDYQSLEKIILSLIILGIIIFLIVQFSIILTIGYFTKKIIKNDLIWFIIVLPFLFIFLEWVKSWMATGFTWLSPSVPLIDYGFAFLFPLVGSLGVSYFFYTLIGIITYLVIFPKQLKVYLLLILLIILMIIGNSLNKQYTIALNKSFTAQIIQSNISKRDKSKRYKVIQNVQKFQLLTQQKPLVELSVWSESSLSLNCSIVQRKLEKGFEAIKNNKIEVLYGAYPKDNNNTYNAIMQLSNNKIAYIKEHLIPFGEYTPIWFSNFSKILPDFYMNNLQTKENNSFINFKDVKLAGSICYEILFGEELRARHTKANVLVHISDLNWFDNRTAQAYLLQVARIRSLEVQKPMIYVVNGGKSAFISPSGEIENIGNQSSGIYSIYQKVTPFEGETFYGKYGDLPLLVWMIGLLCMVYIFNFKIIKKEKL